VAEEKAEKGEKPDQDKVEEERVFYEGSVSYVMFKPMSIEGQLYIFEVEQALLNSK